MKKIFLLFITGCLLSIVSFVNSDKNPLLISYENSPNSITVKDSIVYGQIICQDNYFGIISIPFNPQAPISGHAIFRIKEINAHNWYHTSTIKSSQFVALPSYPFGFPVINNSAGKTYKFEVEFSQKLNSRDKILSRTPTLISQFKYPKAVLIRHPQILLEFGMKKLSYYLTMKNAWKVLLVFYLPLISYLIYLFILNQYIKQATKMRLNRYLKYLYRPLTMLVLSLIMMDIFLIKTQLYILIILPAFLWIVDIILNSYKERDSFIFSLLFLTLCPFLIFAEINGSAEKSAIWFYIFLAIGTFQSLIDSSPLLQRLIVILNSRKHKKRY